MKRPLAHAALRVLFPLTLIASSISTHARADAGSDAYLAVREEVAQFRENTAQRKFRHHYERLIEKLTRVAKDHPKSDRADDALFVAAQLHDELFQVSLVGKDLQSAIDAYEEMAKRYPTSNLADDALFRAGTLKLERLGDKDGARALFVRITKMQPAPDMRPQAAELLARLPASAAPTPAAARSTTKPSESVAKDAKDSAKSAPKDMAEILKRVESELSRESGAVVVDQEIVAAVETGDVDAGVQANADGPVSVVHDAPAGKIVGARRVNGVKHERSSSKSRVMVRVSDAVGVKQGVIAATDDAPHRVFFELTPVRLGKQALKPVDVNDGVVKRVRVGQYSADVVRVVVELERDVAPEVSVKKRPFELVIDVPRAETRAPVLADASPARAAQVESDAGASSHDDDAAIEAAVEVADVRERLGKSGAPGGVSLSEQMGLQIRRVVIDAGHGGHDTGAIGPTGLKEKDVTLAIAKRVKKRLEERVPGIEVVLTRDDDRFLELSERTAIANGVGADLFISIHANANPSRKVNGVETYYLNITSDRYAIRLAQRENAETQGDVNISDLEFILADLAMKSNVDDSIRLGRHVQGSLVGRLRQDHKDVADLGLKHALFFVLLGSRMPAILVETSFISNRTEEKRLGSDKYQEAVADGVVKGVQRFLDERQASARY